MRCAQRLCAAGLLGLLVLAPAASAQRYGYSNSENVPTSGYWANLGRGDENFARPLYQHRGIGYDDWFYFRHRTDFANPPNFNYNQPRWGYAGPHNENAGPNRYGLGPARWW